MKRFFTFVPVCLAMAAACRQPSRESGTAGMLEDSAHVPSAEDSAFVSRGDTLMPPNELSPFIAGGGRPTIGMADDTAQGQRDTTMVRYDSVGRRPALAPAEPRKE